MKKVILVILISGLFVSFSAAQKLLDIYKNGPVKLIAEKTYGAKNNWESIFNLYYDTLKLNKGIPELNKLLSEEYKKIIVAQDGSVFMSHKNRHEIWKFGSDGSFEKKFGSKGGKANQFPMLPSVQPIVDGKYVFTNDVHSRLKFFDLEGNYFKSITLKYMAGDFHSIGNGEIIFEGRIMLKSDRYIPPGSIDGWKHKIVILNIYTGEEKTIYVSPAVKDISFPKSQSRDSIMKLAPEFSKIYLPNSVLFRAPVITIMNDGRFMISNRENGDVKILNKSGKEINKFNLDITPVSITEKDVMEHYETTKKVLLKTRERFFAMPDPPEDKVVGNIVTTHASYPDKKEVLARTEKALSMIDSLKNIKGYYPYLPYFSNIIVDDEGNLLVFEFTSKDQKESNIFNVIAYDNMGKKLARTSFICEDYDLSFSESTFVISKGYVYAVAKLKNYKGMPLRLVKFKISN